VSQHYGLTDQSFSSFMWVISNMSETECSGQLKIKKTLLKMAFDQMFPRGFQCLLSKPCMISPLMTAKAVDGPEASAQADQIHSMPQVSQAVPHKPEWCLSIIVYLSMVCQLPILQHTSPRYLDKAAIEAPLVSSISGLAAGTAVHSQHVYQTC